MNNLALGFTILILSVVLYFILKQEYRYFHRENQVRRKESRNTNPIPSRNVDPFHLQLKKISLDSDTVGGYYIEFLIYSPFESVKSIYALADTGSDFLIVTSSKCKDDKCKGPVTGLSFWPCIQDKEKCDIDNCGADAQAQVLTDGSDSAVICKISGTDQHFTYGDGDFEGFFYHVEMETNSGKFINFEMAAIDKIISGEAPNTCGLLPSSQDLITKEGEDRSFIGQILKHIKVDSPMGYIIDMKNDVIKFGDVLGLPHIPLATDVTDSNGNNISDKYFFLKVSKVVFSHGSEITSAPKYIIIDTGTSLCGFNTKFFDQIKDKSGSVIDFVLEDGSTLNMTVPTNKDYLNESHMDFLDSGEFGDAIILGQIVLSNKIISVDLGRSDGVKRMAIEN